MIAVEGDIVGIVLPSTFDDVAAVAIYQSQSSDLEIAAATVFPDVTEISADTMIGTLADDAPETLYPCPVLVDSVPYVIRRTEGTAIYLDRPLRHIGAVVSRRINVVFAPGFNAPDRYATLIVTWKDVIGNTRTLRRRVYMSHVLPDIGVSSDDLIEAWPDIAVLWSNQGGFDLTQLVDTVVRYDLTPILSRFGINLAIISDFTVFRDLVIALAFYRVALAGYFPVQFSIEERLTTLSEQIDRYARDAQVIINAAAESENAAPGYTASQWATVRRIK